MKATGAELKRFMDDDAAWPKGYVFDDCGVVTHDDHDKWIIPDDRVLDTDDFGELCFELDTRRPYLTFTSVFRRWKKSQATTTFLVEVPKEQAESLRVVCKEKGWKVLS